jgi:hypothetical protein
MGDKSCLTKNPKTFWFNSSIDQSNLICHRALGARAVVVCSTLLSPRMGTAGTNVLRKSQTCVQFVGVVQQISLSPVPRPTFLLFPVQIGRHLGSVFSTEADYIYAANSTARLEHSTRGTLS